ESTSSTSPATIMGGTWERFGNGRVLVGVSENESEFKSVNKSGGSKTHTLTVDEMSSHSHAQYVSANNGNQAIRRDYSS
ncbi:phage baseplate protein, partial [Streptococcus agalactiae]|uniref:phage baseplate protein n=1 Tax=Streptococcus agalactiae TaxID=1311 RepID=UPI003CC69C4A